MTAKEYLSQIRKYDSAISARIHELQERQRKATYIHGVRYDKDKVQSSVAGTGFPSAEEQADLELELERMIRQLEQTRHVIIGQIEAMDNPEHVQLLVERYVKYHTFEDIVDIMHYSYPYIIQLHGQALMEFDKKYHIKS